MTQVTMNNARQILGLTAVDGSGDKIGKIEQVYLNDQTGQPEWVTVSTGLFGKNESFAPLSGAAYNNDTVTLIVTKDLVKGAPQIADDGHLEEAEQAELYRYYAGQLGTPVSDQSYYQDGAVTGADTTGRGAGMTTGRDAGMGTDTDAMTRSEERLHIGTEQVVAGRARLVKYIVTENVTKTVPVSHEEVRIVREPITDETAVTGIDLSESEHEVTLHAERPVVTTETIAVERVHLATETVTEQEQVTGTVRKEQIELHDETTDVITK